MPYLKEGNGYLLKQEKQLLEVKYSAPRFGTLSEDERDMAATKALMSISVITGWTIPNPGLMLDVLIDQFKKKMIESYQNLNMEEIEYAFRNKGLDTKDWGKALNLALLDEVLKPYLHNRADLSLQEEKISSQLQLPPDRYKSEDGTIYEKKPEPMSDEDWEEWLPSIAEYKLMEIPCDAYNYLVRKKLIDLSADQKHEYMAKAIHHLSSITEPLSNYGIELERMKKVGKFSPDVTGTLITISKRLVVFDYFTDKKLGKKVVTKKYKKNK